MYQILLLDIDGTLLDFQKSQKLTLEKAFQAFDYPLTEETKRRYEEINHGLWKQYERGEITRETVIYSRFERLFKELGIEDDGIAFENTYQELLGQSACLLDGALELVQYLYKKYELYVITNGVTQTQKQRLHDSGLDVYMKDIFISGEIGAQKPQKEFFDVCLERIGSSVEKNSMLIIGDTLSSDILGGIYAGIDTCWYNPGGLAADPDIPSTYTVRSFRELRKLL
jgi:2-haloacid dehalogenase